MHARTTPRPDAQSWRDQAACRGHNYPTFVPVKGDNSSVKTARAYCNACPVRDACRQWALDLDNVPASDPAVYGGLTPRQRAAIRAAIGTTTTIRYQQEQN